MEQKIDSIMLGNNIKAFVLFNGKSTVAIRNSYNVTSITDLGTANYRVNYAQPILESVPVCTSKLVDSNAANNTIAQPYSIDSGSFSMRTVSGSGTAVDCEVVCVAVFGKD